MSDVFLATRLQTAMGDAYRLERELPGGGMSRLFVALEASLNRRVVIKVLPPELASNVSAARFKKEIELAAHLQHPHILPILAAGAKDDLLYYVMPFVAGESLRQHLEQQGELPVEDALRILREVADALGYRAPEGDRPPRHQAREHPARGWARGARRFRRGARDRRGAERHTVSRC